MTFYTLKKITELKYAKGFYSQMYKQNRGNPMYIYICVPQWAKGFERDSSVFSMLEVAGSTPKFQKPKNFKKGRLQ